MIGMFTALAPHPVTYFVASLLAGLVALQCQHPSRKPLVAVCLVFSWLAFSNIVAIFSNPDYASCLGIFILLWCSHIVHALLIEKHATPLPNSPTPTVTASPDKASSVSPSWDWVINCSTISAGSEPETSHLILRRHVNPPRG